jgi:LacI family transcriptional regulator
MPKPRHVAILIGSSITWREKVMRGIAGYSHEHGHWHVYTAPEGEEDAIFFPDNYKWDGLIVRIRDWRLARRVMKLAPAVSIGSVRSPSVALPRVHVDESKLTALAVRHFLSGGVRRFAYCAWLPRNSEDRGPAFAAQLATQGHECLFYSDYSKLDVSASWKVRQNDLANWVRKLPKPIGILAWNPDVACQLVEACSRTRISVPKNVAVVAADDDRFKCELSSPSVSAIEIPAERIGYEAAALLDRMMDGDPFPSKPVLIEPAGVVTVRQSSNTFDLPDRDVHLALQFIKDNVAKGIGVPDIAQHLSLSRRRLERNFQRALGYSPGEQIRRARLDLSRQMLLETDLPAAKIAAASGFASPSHFSAFFQTATGLTPLSFRGRYRLS